MPSPLCVPPCSAAMHLLFSVQTPLATSAHPPRRPLPPAPADEDEDDSAAAEPVAKTKKLTEQVKGWKVLNDNQVRALRALCALCVCLCVCLCVSVWGGSTGRGRVGGGKASRGGGGDFDGTESVQPACASDLALARRPACALPHPSRAACLPTVPACLQALWLRPPGDVSSTEYVKFYRALSKVGGWVRCGGWGGGGLTGGQVAGGG